MPLMKFRNHDLEAEAFQDEALFNLQQVAIADDYLKLFALL